MAKKAKLKPMVFHVSFEEQKLYGLQSSVLMSPAERLAEMYRLNRKIYGEQYGKISKTIEVYSSKSGETVHDFYKRINQQ